MAYVFIFLVCIAFFSPGLTSLPPTDRDESLFAQASKQMIEKNNYIDIRIQDKPRYKKPIGIYWLQAASVNLFNPDHLNEIWAYRIPSFVGASIAVLTTAAIGALLFNPVTGLIAALMMASSLLLNVEARLAKTDAALLGCIMLMQYALASAYTGRGKVWISPILLWCALAAGILIKGPIILLILISTLVWLRVANKDLSWFRTLHPRRGILFSLLMIMPWFLAIILQSHGEFIQESAGQDLIAKIWHGQDRGALPPGIHLMALPAIFFPASLFVMLALPDTLKQRHHPSVRFLLGWIIPFWIVFELTLTKLPHYVMPAYPAISILAAKAMTDGFPYLTTRWKWWGLFTKILWTIVGISLATGLAVLPILMDLQLNSGQILISASFVISLGFILYYFSRDRALSVQIMTISSMCFLAYAFASTLPEIKTLWVTQQLINRAELFKPCTSLHLTSASYDEPSVLFMGGTDTHFSPSGSEAANQLIDDPCLTAVIDNRHQQDFLDVFAGKNMKPVSAGDVAGFNIGAGRMSHLSIYILPPVTR